MIYDVIIIGSGMAGLTAAFRCGRSKRSVLLFSGDLLGGILLKTDIVENFPSYPEGILGSDLMDKMVKQAEKYGTHFVRSMVDQVDFTDKIKKVWSDGQCYEARSVAVCTGSSHNRLNIPGEEEFDYRGVVWCFVCDAALYEDQHVVVIGSGDSACGGADYFTKYCSKVTLAIRSNKFRASKIMVDRVLSNPKIEVLYNTTVEEILGDDEIRSVAIKTNEQLRQIECNGVCPCIGSYPNTALFKGILNMDQDGYLLKDTGVAGIFTAGDCSDPKYKQADVAAGEGSKISIDIEDYLNLNF